MLPRLLTLVTTLSSLFIASGAFVSGSPEIPTFAAPTLVSLALSSDTSEMVAEVEVGDKIPSVRLMELKEPGGKPEVVNLADLIAGKKVAIFGVPGAFTPGCSKSHLPSFMDAQGDLKSKGVDLTICVATNDAYVMEVRMA